MTKDTDCSDQAQSGGGRGGRDTARCAVAYPSEISRRAACSNSSILFVSNWICRLCAASAAAKRTSDRRRASCHVGRCPPNGIASSLNGSVLISFILLEV